jgi:hypothetical protein
MRVAKVHYLKASSSTLSAQLENERQLAPAHEKTPTRYIFRYSDFSDMSVWGAK